MSGERNPWLDALDWPSIHGVWWASYIKKPRSYEKVFAFIQAGKMKVVFQDGGSPIRGYWKFIPADVEQPPPLPAPPGPWDYEPKDGDCVWRICPSRNEPPKIGSVTISDDGGLFIHPVGYVASLKAVGYRFALAKVEPPPEFGK